MPRQKSQTPETQLTMFNTPSFERKASALANHRLSTNTTTYAHSIHRWFNFIAGFSPEFVAQCCAQAELIPGNTVLDPFAGCGTAPLAACQLGFQAIGYDAHPVFTRIARAKLPVTSFAEEAESAGAAIYEGLATPADLRSIPAAPREFLGKLFSTTTLRSLFGARQALHERGLCHNNVAFLMLSRIVEKSTHSKTDGIYKAPTSKRSAQDPFAALAETLEMMLGDYAENSHVAFHENSVIHHKSSECMVEVPDDSVSLVVTSPPYLNNFDYAEMTRMLLYFWGIANSWGEITEKVRSKLIVNTTTALKGHKDIQSEYRATLPEIILSELDELVADLRAERLVRPGKKEYDFLVYPYFSQMRNVLNECWRVLTPACPIHIMVSDAALYGVHVRAPQILATMMENIGFRDVECEQIRKRGHRWVLAKRDGSKYGLGEYHIRASK